MTSPRQRPARHSPPLTSREAALVGALTAFAKAPAASKSPSQATSLAHGRRPQPPQSKPSLNRTTTHSTVRSPSSSPRRAVRHDSTAVSAGGHGVNNKENALLQNDNAKTRQGQGYVHEPRRRPSKLDLIDNRAERDDNSGPSAPNSASHLPKDKSGGEALDEVSIPSTSSLVKLYESKGTTKAAIRPDTPLKSPKPTRKSLVLNQDDHTVSSILSKAQETGSKDAASSVPIRHFSVKSDISSADSFASAQDTITPMPDKSSTIEKPSLPPRRPSVQASMPIPQSSPREPVPTLTPQSLPPNSISPHSQSTAAASNASIQATYNSLHPRRLPALRTGDSLANAIVASSLASSRAPSPNKASPGPPRLRPQRSHHSIFARTPSPNKHKPPSAPGGLAKHTLRKEKEISSDNEDGVMTDDPYYKHKRKRRLHKHANKYHEGDRKRWRNAVTETERTRYEGVWAANKGLLSNLRPSIPRATENKKPRSRPSPRRDKSAKSSSWRNDERALLYGQLDADANDDDDDDDDDTPATDDQDPGPDHGEDVHGFVVRDIWHRSRLPAHVLEDVWALVDLGGGAEPGWLGKEEFVVGLWLVDQRLKGKKLPVRVSDSVWDSVRLLKGIRIRSVKDGRGRGW